uniref:DUF1474 family protein n=1 Tax=Schistosoma mansoni TaxID=6183 RepID=A0A5K4F6Z3_SCHMA
MIVDINCKSKREVADTALLSMSAFMNHVELMKAEYPTIHLNFTQLNTCFNEQAEHYKKMKSDHSEEICQMLTQYNSSDLEEIDVYINMKYYNIYQFNFKLYEHDLISRIIDMLRNNSNDDRYYDPYK